MFRYPLYTMYNMYINIYGQGFGILFRSVKFSVFFSLISDLLRGLQKMAASKPITWPIWINTALISLNKNFGTLLTLVLGCFPLDIQPYRTMSDYSIYISSPSENKYSLVEPSRLPNVYKKYILHFALYKGK